MQQYRFDTSIEPMVSRIPSLFAYLEFNDDFTTTLHPATDSLNGTWGKVVENIALPCGVGLCSYVIMEGEPEDAMWNNENTLLLSESLGDGNAPGSPRYLRKVTEYEYVETEDSDAPIYVETDEFPYPIDDTSYKAIKIPEKDNEGNYVYDCDGNKIYTYYLKKPLYIYYERICFLSEGTTYSYRTLIDYYYEYKDTLPIDNPFVAFMRRGIGKIEINKAELHLDNDNDYPNVPDYIYLANIRQLISLYEKLHRTCEYYHTRFLAFGQTDERLGEKCNTYQRMGGDVFLGYLRRLQKKANETASEYLCYAENRSTGLELHLNIPIFQSKNDIGYLSTDMNVFEPGGHYRHGELLTYEGRTYICILNRFVNGGNNYPFVLCNGDLYSLSNNTYEKVDYSDIHSTVLPTSLYDGNTFIRFAGSFYIWEDSHYNRIDVTEYCTGVWNDDIELNEFDGQHFVLLTNYIGSNALQLSIPQKDIFSTEDKWYSYENTYGNRFAIFVDMPYIPAIKTFPNIRYNDLFYIWNDEYSMYIPDPDNAGMYTVHGMGDSKLKTLRKYEQFVGGDEMVDEPSDMEDWLYYYKIGNFNANGSIVWDDYGNIMRFTDTTPATGQYVTDLMAYGTILTDITCNTIERTITFSYVENAHLKAVLEDIGYDEDGNVIYRYGPFEHDDADTHGVSHNETYHYSDDDIDMLVENGDFQAFVENRPQDIVDYMLKYGYRRFVFTTSNSTSSVTAYGNDYDYPYVLSEFTEDVVNELDYIYQPLFKRDYFTGYQYEPIVDSSVDIRRGNAAAYERHIKLGSYKTLNDMAESGFFSMTT